MAFDFPASPTIDQTYPATPIAGIPSYKWDGEKWVIIGIDINTKVSKAGDTMTGPLALASDSTVPTPPTVGNDNIANTSYVETRASAWGASHASSRVAKTGDTMSGSLTAPSVYGTSYLQSAGVVYCGTQGLGVQGDGWYGSGYGVTVASFSPGVACAISGEHIPGVWAGIRLNYGGSYFMDFRGDYCYTTVGGPFIAYSDARIKNVIGDYTNSLDAVAALRPVRFTFKGNETDLHPSNPMKLGDDGKPLPMRKDIGVAPYDTSMHYGAAVDQKEYIGLIAQEAEVSMPETVKLSTAFINGVEVTDLRSLDTGPILFALVNAVKELKARVEELEALNVRSKN
jgi:hypothetical protein